jgi:L-serine/L-threonine ammonia-lyase
VTSSGGNTGLSVAYVSRKLGINSHIIVPKVASQKVINVLMKYGATVEVFGETSADVNYRALELTQKDPNKFYVHPFDHPLLW